MTRRAVVAALAATGLTGGSGAFAATDDAPFAERFVTFDPPVPMAPVALLDRRGRAAILAPVRGRASLIVVWANWCAACHRDVPRLAAVQQRLAREGVYVALVNVDPTPPARTSAPSTEVDTGNVPLFFDPDNRRLAAPSPDGRRSAFQPFGLPILFVVDPVGLVRGYVRGAVDWTREDVIAFFRSFAHA